MVTTQKINILYIITKLELGGAQKQLICLIRGLDKERYNIFLFTAQEGILMPEVLSISDLHIKRSNFLERNLNPIKDFLAMIEIFFFIKTNKIDIVHTHSSKAGILGRIAGWLAGVKIKVHTVHGWPFHQYQPFLTRVTFVLLEKITSFFTDKLIVVSGPDLRKGVKYVRRNKNKYTLIRYGVELECASSEKTLKMVREELKIKEGDILVGNISCFKPQKAPLDYLRLAEIIKKSFPAVKFILVGDGILRKMIENEILRANLQNNVILTGWRKDISAILSSIDIFALTSLWEGMPITVLEAMCCAKPVVATDTGGIREIVIDGYNGFLVNPKDIQTMSQKLLLLLGSKELREKMGSLGRKHLGSKFNLQSMIQANQDLYATLNQRYPKSHDN